MPRQVVILHGWSDTSESFRPLARFLEAHGFETVPLFLGDYISLRDDVTIDDVAKRMEEVVRSRMASGRADRLAPSFDLIVHSTGGLVARRWISAHYRGGRACPVRNLLMLAPANFGSRLAHKGRSMLGRVLKGWKTGFETGEEMLYALELGSPFQWRLAADDLFEDVGGAGRDVFYSADRVRPFVIVGTHPYPDLVRRLINENGSDGTVRVAAANLNARGMTVDFSRSLAAPAIDFWTRRGGDANRFPIAVLPDRTHSEVTNPLREGRSDDAALQARLGELILDALSTESARQYRELARDWWSLTMETRTLAARKGAAARRRRKVLPGASPDYFHEHYQMLVRVEDEFGRAIPDYFITFLRKPRRKWFGLSDDMNDPSAFFHQEVLEDTHVHGREPANRAFFLDRYDLMRSDGFYSRIRNGPKRLYFAVTAADPGRNVAYLSAGGEGRRAIIALHQMSPPGGRWLKRHRTHFVKIIIPRVAKTDLFALKRYQQEKR